MSLEQDRGAQGAPPVAPVDLSSVPIEERDQLWFSQVYQGDQVPQLTFRAVLMGGVLGMLMSISNLYTTLKLGWAFGVAITACVLSYSLWNLALVTRLAKSKMTLLENNCMQSAASAAGYSTGGTLATAVGALLLLEGDEHRLGWLPVAIWVLLVALLGVFLAIPMKRQMIDHEQLPFPSGIAAAETLRSLYAEGASAVRRARALIASLGTGAAVGLGRALGWIPGELLFPGTVFRSGSQAFTGANLGIGFEPSVLLAAGGMLVGLRVSISMLLGSLLNYLVLAPWVLGRPAFQAPSALRSLHYFGEMEVALAPDGSLAAVKLLRWSLWFGTALMVSSGLTSFLLSAPSLLRALWKASHSGGAIASPVSHLQVPRSWILWGGLPTVAGLLALSWISFGISPWLGLVAVVLSYFLALVACRATGETDTTPIGAMGKLTQLVYAVLAPAHLSTNLISAGVTAGAAGSAADLLTDLKSGYLLGANPRKQFLAQLYGVFFGVVAVVPAWYLLVPNRAALEAFNSPATTLWAAVATALAQGLHSIPPSAQWALLVGAALGAILTGLESRLSERARNWLPSSMGLGLAFVVPFANALAFFIGALVAYLWRRVHPKSSEAYLVAVASGAVAGESLAAAAQAILANLGIG